MTYILNANKYIAAALFLLAMVLTGCLNPQNSWTRGGYGILLAQGEDAVIIKDVVPEFANENVALLSGDEIVAIDGESMTGVPAQGVSEALIGPVGGMGEITVRRGEEIITFSIERIRNRNLDNRVLNSTRTDSQEVEAMDVPTPSAEPAEESAQAPTEAGTDEPAEESPAELTDELPKELTDEPTEPPTDESTEGATTEPAGEPVEDSADEISEEPVEGTTE